MAHRMVGVHRSALRPRANRISCIALAPSTSLTAKAQPYAYAAVEQHARLSSRPPMPTARKVAAQHTRDKAPMPLHRRSDCKNCSPETLSCRGLKLRPSRSSLAQARNRIATQQRQDSMLCPERTDKVLKRVKEQENWSTSSCPLGTACVRSLKGGRKRIGRTTMCRALVAQGADDSYTASGQGHHCAGRLLLTRCHSRQSHAE